MHPKTIDGTKYCYESIRINRRYTTTRGHGRCEPDSKTECKTCKYNLELKNKRINDKNPRRTFKIPLALRRI